MMVQLRPDRVTVTVSEITHWFPTPYIVICSILILLMVRSTSYKKKKKPRAEQSRADGH